MQSVSAEGGVGGTVFAFHGLRAHFSFHRATALFIKFTKVLITE